MERRRGYYIGVAIFTLLALLSLFSLKDKEVTLTIPDVKQLVAGADTIGQGSYDSGDPAYSGSYSSGGSDRSNAIGQSSAGSDSQTNFFYSSPSQSSGSSDSSFGSSSGTQPESGTGQAGLPGTGSSSGSSSSSTTAYGLSTGGSFTASGNGTNHAPIIDSFLPLDTKPSIDEGDFIDFSVKASDADNDTLTYTWKLDGITQSSVTDSWTYSADDNSSGLHVVTITVSDGFLSDEQSWDVTVNDVNNKAEDEVIITCVYPSSGASGEEIIIQGKGFSANPIEDIITLGSVQSYPVSVISQNQLRAQVPTGLPAGFRDLYVTAKGVKSNKALFDVLHSASANVFIDETAGLLPAGINITDSSVLEASDIDNDKDIDLAVIDRVYARIYLFVNNGSGAFVDQALTRLPAISGLDGVSSIRFCDIDGDSDNDIVMTFTKNQSVRLLVNNGTGTFSDGTASRLPVISDQSVSMDTGDVDGDGDLDIVIASKTGKDKLLLNNGSGAFTQDAQFNLPAVIDGSSDIRFCDTDGDGDLDIITTNSEIVGSSTLAARLYINDGNGNFTDDTASYLPADDEHSSALSFGDMKEDGDLDIVIANFSQNSILMNNGMGVFTDETADRLPVNYFLATDVKTGDVNGDGYQDAVFLGEQQATLLFNDGTAHFSDLSIKLPNYNGIPAQVGGNILRLADIDSDGDLDMIIGGASLYILKNSAANKSPVLDPIGDKTIEAGGTLAFNVNAVDPNDDQLIYTAENLPAGAVYESQLFSWKPTSNDIGKHQGIRFVVTEDTLEGLEDSETISITVASGNLPIIDYYAPPDFSMDLTPGQIVQFGVRAHDPEGGELTFTWKFNGVEIPAINDANSSMLLIFPRIGENDIEVVVSNKYGSVSLKWDITVDGSGNGSPEITSYIPTQSEITIDLTTGGFINFGITATDPENDTLSYEWKFDDNVISTTQNLNASAYAAYAAVGDHTVTVSVNDGHNPAVTHQWTIHIIQTQQNGPPEITSYTPNQAEVTIDLALGNFIDFNVTATDPDNDPLAYEWKFDSNVVSTTQGLDHSAYTAYAAVGDHTVTVSVNDGHNPAVTHQWTVHIIQSGVVNHPPVINSYLPVENIIDLVIGDNQAFSINATDADNDVLTYTWTVNDAVAGGNSNSYTFNALQVGQFIVKVTVTDGKVTIPPEHQWTVNVQAQAEDLLDEIQRSAFGFFWNETDNPATGLVRDRLLVNVPDPTVDSHYYKASMAATGFGLAAFCVAAEKYGDGSDPDWQVTPAELAARVKLILNTLISIQSNQAPEGDSTWGKDGFFYHFVNIETGERWVNSEVSTIDTAIVVAGALAAGEYFKDIDPEIDVKARQIYVNINWKSFIDNTPGGHYNHFYKQWMPGGQAYNNGHWDYTDESLLLYMLAIGSPDPDYAVDPGCYHSTFRELGSYGQNGKAMVQTWFGSLFAYQYTHTFFNLRDMHDARNVDWWNNTRDAVLADRQFCLDQNASYGYNDNVWGLSSAYSVGATYVGDYGAPPLANPNGPTHDGTVNPSVVGASVSFLPAQVLEALEYMKSDTKIWYGGQYGFVDSFKNSAPRVYSDYFVGIDLGSMMAMISNYNNSGLIWNNFMNAQTRYGTMRDLLAQLNFRPNSDPKFYVDLDDTSAKSQFGYGYIDSENTTLQISLNLAQVIPASKYLLTVHSFMNNFAGNYDVVVGVDANNADAGNCIFSHVENVDDPIIGIEIDSSSLQVGQNLITLSFKSGSSWLACKNIEVSSPVLTEEWNIVRSEYGNEYRLDDTYYAGHSAIYGQEAYKTFEQALNLTTDPYTYIFSYMRDLDHDRVLTLNKLFADGTVYVDLYVNEALAASGLSMNSEQHVTIPADLLRDGWNSFRLQINKNGGEWIIWNTLDLALGGTAGLPAPEGLAAAAFGANVINLRWQESSSGNVDGYNIYRSMTRGGPYEKVNNDLVIASSSQDAGLLDRTTYYYVVTAVDVVGARESGYSGEIEVATGPYEVDFGDGKDPNAFGGGSSAQFSFVNELRHDWTEGPVRQVSLNPQDAAYINLNGVNISQATMLSLWIKGNGQEKIEIGLKSTNGQEVIVATTVSGGWQDLRIPLSQFPGINLSSMDKLFIRSKDSSQITLLVDGIEFVREIPSTFSLEVTPMSVSDNSRSTGINYLNQPNSIYAPAAQYIKIKYGVNAENWKIWIYTKNDRANPAFMGGQFNGLLDVPGKHRIPLLWRVYPSAQTGGVPCSVRSDVYNGANMTWNYVKDKNDSDWNLANTPGAEYSVICYGSYTWAHLANVPPSPNDRDPVSSTFYVYTGGVFEKCIAGEYSTMVYFDLTHE